MSNENNESISTFDDNKKLNKNLKSNSDNLLSEISTNISENNQKIIKLVNKEKNDKQQDSYLSKEEYISLGLLVISFITLILQFISIYTILVLSIFTLSLFFIIKSFLKRLRRKGIINILPEGIKYLLLRKSILDILLDFWHLPVLGKYLKLLFSPIIYGYSPEQSIESIEQLEEPIRIKLKSKGILKLLPQEIKNILLPDESEENNKHEIDKTKINKEEIDNVNNDKVAIYKKNSNGEDFSISTSINSNNAKNIKKSINIIKSFSKNNTDFSNKLSGNLSLELPIVLSNKPKNMELFEENISNISVRSKSTTGNNECKVKIYNKDNCIADKNVINTKSNYTQLIYFDKNQHEAEYKINDSIKIENKNYYQPNEYLLVNLPEILEEDDNVYYMSDNDDNTDSKKKVVFKSVVLQSSKKLEEEKKKNLEDESFTWDNHEKYIKLQEINNSKKKSNLSFIDMFKGYFSKALFEKINKNAIYKSLFAFISVLIIQMLINRNMRRYSISALKSFGFIIISLLASSSVYVYFSKNSSDEEEITIDLKRSNSNIGKEFINKVKNSDYLNAYRIKEVDKTT